MTRARDLYYPATQEFVRDWCKRHSLQVIGYRYPRLGELYLYPDSVMAGGLWYLQAMSHHSPDTSREYIIVKRKDTCTKTP